MVDGPLLCLACGGEALFHLFQRRRIKRCLHCWEIQRRSWPSTKIKKIRTEKTKEATRQYRRKVREEKKIQLMELFGSKCKDCGFSGPPECFHFDHVTTGTKLSNVGELLLAKKNRLLAEVAKCDLVCANCHAVRTKMRSLLPHAGPKEKKKDLSDPSSFREA